MSSDFNCSCNLGNREEGVSDDGGSFRFNDGVADNPRKKQKLKCKDENAFTYMYVDWLPPYVHFI